MKQLKIHVDKKGSINLCDLAPVLGEDVRKVHAYTADPIKDENGKVVSVTLKFFDIDGNVLGKTDE